MISSDLPNQRRRLFRTVATERKGAEDIMDTAIGTVDHITSLLTLKSVIVNGSAERDRLERALLSCTLHVDLRTDRHWIIRCDGEGTRSAN